MLKKVGIFFVIALSIIITNISPTVAAVNIWEGPDKIDTKGQIQAIGFTEKDPREMIATGIKIFLGFLGMLAVILILYAGFLWMTSQGEKEKIEKAQNILKTSVIGLIIILMSYGLAAFVLTQINLATGK